MNWLLIILILFLSVPTARCVDVSDGTAALNFDVNPCYLFNRTDCDKYGCYWCNGDCQRGACAGGAAVSGGGGVVTYEKSTQVIEVPTLSILTEIGKIGITKTISLFFLVLTGVMLVVYFRNKKEERKEKSKKYLYRWR